jgi:antitoxin MazE
MRVHVRKWGNSLALRIPKSFAEEASLREESVVDIKVINGKLVVSSVPEPEVTLEKLLADVNERNLHRALSTGPAEEPEER